MTDFVAQTLKHWRQTRFEWGRSDCLLSLADYLVLRGYPDFGTPFRGTYNDEAGALAHIARCGGEVDLIGSTGLAPITCARRGDIVLVELDTPIAGLCTGADIAFRTLRGVILLSARRVRVSHAWGV